MTDATNTLSAAASHLAVAVGILSIFLLLNAPSLLAESEPPLIPLEHFAKLPRFSDPEISPNGEYLVATIPLKGQPLVVVQKLRTPDDPDPGKIVPITTGEYFLDDYHWVNDERLLISVRREVKVPRMGLTNLTASGTVGRDGTNPKFFRKEADDWGYYRQYADVVSWLENDDDHTLMALDNEPDK
jgi:hypothetical protein